MSRILVVVVLVVVPGLALAQFGPLVGSPLAAQFVGSVVGGLVGGWAGASKVQRKTMDDRADAAVSRHARSCAGRKA